MESLKRLDKKLSMLRFKRFLLVINWKKLKLHADQVLIERVLREVIHGLRKEIHAFTWINACLLYMKKNNWKKVYLFMNYLHTYMRIDCCFAHPEIDFVVKKDLCTLDCLCVRVDIDGVRVTPDNSIFPAFYFPSIYGRSIYTGERVVTKSCGSGYGARAIGPSIGLFLSSLGPDSQDSSAQIEYWE